jgi:hypothetical protein
MTGAAPARRLLAQLVDEQAIETEPIQEIRADLAALGIDPARAVALSRRLAAGYSPAASLLRRISAAEEDDEDIRRLEQADIGAVRRELPEGVAAAASARAHRAAGGESNVVGFRRHRSRRLLYGLSGVAAAMAASLVFYVGLSNEHAFRPAPPPQAPEAARALPPAEMERRDAQPAQLAERPASEPRSAEGDAATSESVVARQQLSDESIQAANQPAASGTQSPPASESEPVAATPLAAPAPSSPRSDQQLSAAAGTGEAPMGAAKMAEERAKAERNAPLDVASRYSGAGGVALSGSRATPLSLGHPVTALLIVDAGLLPAGMRQNEYPSGDLPDRLADARRVAGDRPIAALVTMQVEGRAVDAIVLPSNATEREKASPSSAPLGPVLPGYELIELDRR